MDHRGPWPPLEELIRGLEDPDRFARCRAAQGLGEGRDPRAVEPLLRALRDPAGDVRAKAAVALGRIRDERALGSLIEAMGDPKVSVRSGASAAVKKFGKRAYRPLVDAYRGAGSPLRMALIGILAHHKTAEVFGLLLDAYREVKGPERTTLLDALARHATPAASEFLIAALDDPDVGIRRHVVDLLGRRKDRRAVERLLGALSEAKGAFENAIRARDAVNVDEAPLGRMQEVVAEWAEVYADLDGYVRALGEIGDERAFGPLQELLEAEGPHDLMPLVVEIVRALRKIDNARAVDLLHGLLNDPSYPGRDRLELTLAGMDLMGAAQSLVSRAAGGNLGILGQGLGAILASQAQLHSQGAGIECTATDEGEASRIGTDLMRRLEETLRTLGRSRPGA
jgi:HEAT repeat protein